MTSAFHCVRYPSQFGIPALGTESRIHLPPPPGLQTLCPLLSAAFRSHATAAFNHFFAAAVIAFSWTRARALDHHLHRGVAKHQKANSHFSTFDNLSRAPGNTIASHPFG